jgi:hypothetical protein
MKTKKTRGGPREGSGRPTRFGEGTTLLTVRVPLSKKAILKAVLEKELKKYEI